MKIFFWVSIFWFHGASSAQAPKTYTIKPGENILEVLSLSEIFKYPSFINGTVLFRDGRKVRSRLNYNILIGQIQFINERGDTLTLAEEETIKYVLLENDSFFYSKGYMQLIASDSSVRLGKKVYFKEFEQKPGSYGLSSGTTAAVNLSSILERRAYNLNTHQELVLRKCTEYFLGDRNEFLLADKKNLIKLFPKYKKTITTYLESNPVNFNSEEDLLRLTAFLQVL